MMLGAEEARRLVRATGRTPLEVASRAADDDGVDAMTPSTKSAVSQLRRVQKIQKLLNRTVTDDEEEESFDDDDDLEEKEVETNHKEEEESYFGWGMKKLVNGLKDLGNSSGSTPEEENDENTKPRSASPPPPPPKNIPKLKGGKNIVRDKSPERRYVDVMSQFNTTATTSNSKKN